MGNKKNTEPRSEKRITPKNKEYRRIKGKTEEESQDQNGELPQKTKNTGELGVKQRKRAKARMENYPKKQRIPGK
ncbi:MAG: hypothetical protein IJ137_06395 [Eubacterium sp.]|nr:hypothetical protein [Eubacterium sp.]